MNDVNNRIFREFTEFFDNVEKSASEISVTIAYDHDEKYHQHRHYCFGIRGQTGGALLEPSQGAK